MIPYAGFYVILVLCSTVSFLGYIRFDNLQE